MVADILAVGIVSPAPGSQEEALAELAAGTQNFIRHPEFIGADGVPQTGGYVEGCLTERDVIARLAYLFHTAYSECIARLPADTPPDARWRLFFALPEWLGRVEGLRTKFLQTMRGLNLTRIRKVDFHFGEKTAGFAAYQAACQALEEEDNVLVACVDSFVAPAILDARALKGLAHVQDDPYSVIPAEAGTVMLLGRPDAGSSVPVSRMRPVSLGNEAEQLDDSDRGVLGFGLVECIRAALGELAHGSEPGCLISDSNGERHRAEELGVVLANFAGDYPVLAEPEIPALAIGDVGAATAGLFAAIVPHLAALKTPHVLITGSENDGARAAMVVDQVR